MNLAIFRLTVRLESPVVKQLSFSQMQFLDTEKQKRLRLTVHDWGETLEQGSEPPTAPRTAHCSRCVCVHCSRCVCVCPLLQVCVCVSTAPGVCALGWVKCREHISLLVILCIIVYVTNKAHLSLILSYIYWSIIMLMDLIIVNGCNWKVSVVKSDGSLHMSVFLSSRSRHSWVNLKSSEWDSLQEERTSGGPWLMI